MKKIISVMLCLSIILMYGSISAVNAAETKESNSFNDWGLHKYVAADGSYINPAARVVNGGAVQVSGNQTSGAGELGITYLKPITVSDGFSVEFGLDKYITNGLNGADSWISVQLSDRSCFSDDKNLGYYRRQMNVGSGNSDYGSGFVMLLRPCEDNHLMLSDIYWNGVKISENTATVCQNWQQDSQGCYSEVSVDSFSDIKLDFVPSGDGFKIKLNDGNFSRIGGERIETEGNINPDNGFSGLNTFFNSERPAYVSVVYHSNAENSEAQFTLKEINGSAPAVYSLTDNTLNDWALHRYIAAEGTQITPLSKANSDGSLTVYGNQSAGYGELGVSYSKPVDLSAGFSIGFGLDAYSENGTDGTDSWISLQITDKIEFTDVKNYSPMHRQMDVGNGSPDYGSGLVMLMRPCADNHLAIGEIFWNGVSISVNTASVQNNWQLDNQGCYGDVTVKDFSDLKLSFVPDGNDYRIILNDGCFARIGGDRIETDGSINPNNGFSGLNAFFNSSRAAYVSLVYHSNVSDKQAQFTIKEFNGCDAMTDSMKNIRNAYELFNDTHFTDGFNVQSMDKSDTNIYQLNYGGDVSGASAWKLAQWDSVHNLQDSAVTSFANPESGVYSYSNPSKLVTVDTNTGELGLRLNASQVYQSPRVNGQAWPHLLIEGGMNNSAGVALQLKNASELRFTVSQKLTYFKDCMNGSANNGLHASQFLLYLYVKGIRSDGCTEMMWFGIPLFDNRTEFCDEYAAKDAGKDDASGLFIYNIPAKAYTSTSFHQNGVPVGSADNEWMNIDFDVLPYVTRALNLAKARGYMKGVTMDTVYIDGMNLGWEMPGTYDAEMVVKNLSLKSYVDWKLGDIDKNGTVSSVDALLALQSTVKKTSLGSDEKFVGDVNKDKLLDVSDALKILQKSVGKIESF